MVVASCNLRYGLLNGEGGCTPEHVDHCTSVACGYEAAGGHIVETSFCRTSNASGRVLVWLRKPQPIQPAEALMSYRCLFQTQIWESLVHCTTLDFPIPGFCDFELAALQHETNCQQGKTLAPPVALLRWMRMHK